jgi:hypothetical protein
MTDKKFTDEEIIEALDLCTQQNGSIPCYDCPCWNDDEQECKGIDYTATLNLIKRQKAEIERLKSANDEKFRQWDMLAEKTKQHYADLYNEAKDKLKAEAYRVFAEALRKHYDNPVWYLGGSNGFFDNLDSLVKEMLGGESDE